MSLRVIITKHCQARTRTTKHTHALKRRTVALTSTQFYCESLALAFNHDLGVRRCVLSAGYDVHDTHTHTQRSIARPIASLSCVLVCVQCIESGGVVVVVVMTSCG